MKKLRKFGLIKSAIVLLMFFSLIALFILIAMFFHIKSTRMTFSSVTDMKETVCGSYTSYKTAYNALDDEGEVLSKFEEESVPEYKIVIEDDFMIWTTFLYHTWGTQPYDKVESKLSVSDWNPYTGEFLAGGFLKCKVMKDGTVVYSDNTYYPDE